MNEIFKVLGDENRLRIVSLLMQSELCVCEIEVLLEMTQSNVSRHLGKLKGIGIISSSKDAQWVHYKYDDKFRKINKSLIEYIEEKFSVTAVFKNDLMRYENYKKSNLNCTRIADNKEKVLNLIK